MRNYYIYYLVAVCFFSCSEDDKAIDVVVNEIERGAILRNIERISKDFIHEDFESTFSLTIEEQDLEEGDLLDFVRMYLAYEDRNDANGINTTSETVLGDIPKSDFFTGEFGLPRTTITLSYQDAVDSVGLDAPSILPGDQFKLRLEIHLTDGRTFSTDTGSASILTDYCFFKSPYRYEIAVIEPMDDQLFTGVYSYNLLSDNAVGIDPIDGVTSVSAGGFINTRLVPFGFSERVEITFSGSKIYPKIYQSVNGFCRESQFHILSGPAQDTFGQFEVTDDTVFFVDIALGFEGWDGGSGGERILSYKFTKQ